MTDECMPNFECTKVLTRMEEQLRINTELTQKIANKIYGNGKPGHDTRIDRLEVEANNRRWSVRLVAGGILSVVVWLIIGHIKSKG